MVALSKQLGVGDTYTVIVVDDEPLARTLIVESLSLYKELTVVASCKNGREAIEAIREHKADLLFLDIHMPGLSGFDVIRAIDPKILPETIFVTATDDFAIEAFDVNAVDYLLKPISEERLERALKRAFLQLASKQDRREGSDAIYEATSKIAERVKRKQEKKVEQEQEAPVTQTAGMKLSIKDGGTLTIVDQEDIDWIDAAGDYMCIHVDGDTHVMRTTMSKLLEKLDENKFKRIHRSTIVNIERVIKIQKHTKGEYILHLDCDHTLKVSRHYKTVIQQYIEEQL